ncbi:hypothetical protein ASG37_01060 [Sphingomonas sp. Leaf407]|nr:hypothetical protein ASE97_01090 [Sphingomonas sp. Leaf42]KQT29785.1 hypothetical protein ASG37_01060 [Sphingomonas sp. Leaf407]
MIRVAHVLPHMAVGGRERIVADLCRSAPRHGVMPVIVTFDAATGAVVEPEAPVVSLDRRSATFARSLHETIAAERIDVVHAHGHVTAALLPSLAVPVVTTLHVALGSGWRWLPAITAGLRRSAAITAVSDDLARRFRWAGRPISVIAPGIDLARFAGVQRVGDGGFTLGIAARLHPVKRHGDLIAALRLLDRRGQRYRLLIAGDGPTGDAIREAGAGLDVTLLGAVDDVAGFLGRLDGFVLPSDHEGTPVALIEAMAAGLPIVASAVGGIPALVGDAGLLVPRRSPRALAEAIERLATSRDLRHRLGSAARQRVAGHGLDRQADAYRAVYRNVVPHRD